jgi:hypothetical protein
MSYSFLSQNITSHILSKHDYGFDSLSYIRQIQEKTKFKLNFDSSYNERYHCIIGKGTGRTSPLATIPANPN